MTDLAISLLPWQQQVWDSEARFKVVAAGRRTGKSRLAAYLLLLMPYRLNKDKSFMLHLHRGKQEILCGRCY